MAALGRGTAQWTELARRTDPDIGGRWAVVAGAAVERLRRVWRAHKAGRTTLAKTFAQAEIASLTGPFVGSAIRALWRRKIGAV